MNIDQVKTFHLSKLQSLRKYMTAAIIAPYAINITMAFQTILFLLLITNYLSTRFIKAAASPRHLILNESPDLSARKYIESLSLGRFDDAVSYTCVSRPQLQTTRSVLKSVDLSNFTLYGLDESLNDVSTFKLRLIIFISVMI